MAKDDSPIPPPPRLLPDRPFPPYAYTPRRHPHPIRDPEGHSYGMEVEEPAAPDPTAWRGCGDYLYGIDLFNHGFFWEAHEVWEGLWHACGRRGPTALFLQALINMAAAGFQVRRGNARGMRANAKTALRLFQSAASAIGSGPGCHKGRYMGLDLAGLTTQAAAISNRQSGEADRPGDAEPREFGILLWPE